MKTCSLLIGLSLLLACRPKVEPVPTDVPACIRTIMQQNGKVSTSTLSFFSITRYKYQNRYVYVGFSECCDRYDVLFDDSCRVLCSPSGSITGLGDGRCPAFFNEATEQTEIWQRPR